MLNSTATRILFDNNKRAVGVEFVHDGKIHRVSVAKEVVISGGIYFNINIQYQVKLNKAVLSLLLSFFAVKFCTKII